MPPETEAAPEKTVVAAPKPLFAPFANHFPTGLRDEVLAEIDDFQPKNANPASLQAAKDAAKALIAALPEAARGAEVRLEVTGVTGTQLLVQVIPALLKKS